MNWPAADALPRAHDSRSLPFRALLLAVALGLAITTQGCASSSAIRPGAPPQASAGTSCRLTVTITTTSGTTWGTVTATSGGASFTFGQATRTIGIPCGATVKLTELPTDSNSWPFHGWRVGAKKVTGTSTSTVVSGADAVDAVYVLSAPGSTSPTATASGN
ncbi:MAG TPA: hypothetical protein VMW80_00790 [Candidatus Dormibacteraeota bacterium]|nr:hypothetical protein [Candidatus Dormibacteraeota bacterium]